MPIRAYTCERASPGCTWASLDVSTKTPPGMEALAGSGNAMDGSAGWEDARPGTSAHAASEPATTKASRNFTPAARHDGVRPVPWVTSSFLPLFAFPDVDATVTPRIRRLDELIHLAATLGNQRHAIGMLI